MANKYISWSYRNFLPDKIQQNIDILRGQSQIFRPCFQKTKSIFIHIPKAAGTSLSIALYGHNIGHRKAIDYKNISAREFSKYLKFTFVRNPWDRAVSAYQFAVKGGTHFVQPNPNQIYQSDYFKSFETFVTTWLPCVDLSQEDVIFSPQFMFIFDSNLKCLVDFIGKVEQMDTDLTVIESKLGLKINVERLNISDRNSNYRDYYNDKTREIIANIYKKDIELFEYEF